MSQSPPKVPVATKFPVLVFIQTSSLSPGSLLAAPSLKLLDPDHTFSCVQNHYFSTHLATNIILDQSLPNLRYDNSSSTQDTNYSAISKRVTDIWLSLQRLSPYH